MLLLEPPELLPPLPEEVGSMEKVVEVDVVVGETVEEVEMETTDGTGGATSGSLPAAFASVGLNVPLYT